MNLCNTSRLRITVNSARRYQLRESKWSRITRFRSADHGRGIEHNWSIVIGPLWLFVKYRPNGKEPDDLYGKGTPKPLSELRASYNRLFRRDSGPNR